MSSSLRIYQLRYSSEYFSNALYAESSDYDHIMFLKRLAVACALAHGNPRLAASFDIS